MNEWTIRVPNPAAPLTMNVARRLNHHVYARQIRNIREQAHWLAAAQRIPALPACEVELHYAPPDNRRRDADGLVAYLKPFCDGLVDAGIVPDDTPNLMRKHMPVIEDPAKPARLWVVVRELVPVQRNGWDGCS